MNNIEFAEAFKNRTKKFVVDNIKLYRTLPKTEEAKIIGRQLLRSASSVGATIVLHAGRDHKLNFMLRFQ